MTTALNGGTVLRLADGILKKLAELKITPQAAFLLSRLDESSGGDVDKEKHQIFLAGQTSQVHQHLSKTDTTVADIR